MLERCNQNVDDLQNQKPVCGLNNAAGIAREMGGTIKIDSKVGERTELNVSSHGLIVCVLLLEFSSLIVTAVACFGYEISPWIGK